MMTETVTNQAAWQKAPGQPLRIGVTALPHLAANEILIRNAAIAINPLDWILQDALLPWFDYPAILGSDVSGEVAAVGGAVERFKVGDRVIGQAVGTTVNQPAQGAFQHHTIVLDHMAAPIPNNIAFADGQSSRLALAPPQAGSTDGHSWLSRHRYTRRPRVQRSFWSGVDRRALAATPSSSRWRRSSVYTALRATSCRQ
jgi:hypothetical protein